VAPSPSPDPQARYRPILQGWSRRLVIALTLVMALAVGVLVLTAPLARAPIVRPGQTALPVGRSPLLDRPAPDIDLLTLDGDRVRLSDLRGRPVLVNFWASWCGPCREEFPLLAAARRDHAADGLEILGVIFQDSPEAARAFYERFGGSWPALVDPGGEVAARYSVRVLPITFYVDRAGIVRTVSYGPPPGDAFEEQLAKIL
jgi:cytochrome c biogenesis protein CcmG, thiol:disulfide interchange protein DsbE